MTGLTVCLLGSSVGLAGGRTAADYPLRVHIFNISEHSHYHNQMLTYVDGEGRANLFENGEPRGFDFSFRCGERLMTSPGYETYLARWKKPGKELELRPPVMGKPGVSDSCDLQVNLKNNTAYIKHGGVVDEEQAAAFKAWMEKHQYDPEHGKDEPVGMAAAGAATGPAADAPQ